MGASESIKAKNENKGNKISITEIFAFVNSRVKHKFSNINDVLPDYKLTTVFQTLYALYESKKEVKIYDYITTLLNSDEYQPCYNDVQNIKKDIHYVCIGKYMEF